jgi:hypothetical protein
MRIRMHRGGYAEAMETHEIIEPTKAAIVKYLRKYGYLEIDTSMVFVIPYDPAPHRGWNSHYMVKVGVYPAAFCDQEVKE